MFKKPKSAREIGAKQKRFFLAMVSAVGVGALLLVSFTHDDSPAAPASTMPKEESKIDRISQEIDPHAIRISALERGQERLGEQIDSLKEAAKEMAEETREMMQNEARRVQHALGEMKEELLVAEESKRSDAILPKAFKSWERVSKKEEHSVAFEIPAGTVLKAVLVSGVDCGVGVQKPLGANPVLLRPIDDGRLPRNIRVPLKGSVLVGSAQGDLSTERVMIRGERLTLVEKDGSFVETEVSAYVSGEDGREGLRGVVVDRSGQIVMRAAFSGFLQGVGQTAEALVNKQKTPSTQESAVSIGVGGGTAAMGKLTDYYIKRAEQLQPAIQIAAGRVVDVIFTKSVKIGEKDLKKKIELQRRLKERHD